MADSQQRPKVGIGVMILKEGKVLLGQRKTAYGFGEYAFPGGHMEHLESFEACARRETREEAGIEIENVRFLMLANMKEYAPKHYVHIQMIADWKSGEPQVMEPEKCEGWGWYAIEAIPEPTFSIMPKVIESYRTNRHYFDS